MHDHATPRTIERHCDVAVVGGSAAGLAAALQVARQRRSVIVVDAGEPRNAPASHMHGYLGFDGAPPATLLDAGRAEVRGYGAEVLDGRATSVARLDDGRLRVQLTGGHSLVARRIVAATGLVDELPPMEGLAAQWGRGVIHCPFCHGYEARDQRLVQIVTHPAGLHPAVLFSRLAGRLTIVLHGAPDVDDATIADLRDAGVVVVDGDVTRVVTGAGGDVEAVEVGGHAPIPADAVVVGPRFHARVAPFADLGLRATAHPIGLGDHVVTDATGLTSVPGVYAAGNVTDPSQQVLHAAADGSRVGAMVSFSLAEDDPDGGARRSANADDWDHRYGDRPMWSGNPNGTLVHEATALSAGRALDVGAGEGGDAIWLAEQGWSVTASDISRRALERVAAEAHRRGLAVDCLHADANDRDAYPCGAFDLVSAQYASIPRTPDGRGVASIIDAVAPGGTLLVVSHDLEPMRSPIDTTVQSRPFDPDAYVRVDDVAAALDGRPGWQIEVHETRPRPPGASSASHHVDDVVLRATRTG